MDLYALTINGDEIVKIESDVPTWLPLRQRINKMWLRTVVADALRRYYRKQSVVKV